MIENIDNILSNLDRKILFAGETRSGEFEYENGLIVKAGTPYHIYYTKDKDEIFATGNEFSVTSLLIFRLQGSTTFAQYLESSFNISTTTTLVPAYPIPTEDEYNIGEMLRYFAVKATDRKSGPIEITKNSFKKDTPYYVKAHTRWVLTLTQNKVIEFNKRAIQFLIDRLGTEVILDPLQYWKPTLSPKEEIEQKITF